MNLKDKKVLVTGASSGIGQAIAIACAEKGAIVLINYRKNFKGAKETLKKVEEHSKGYVFQADLIHEKQIAKMFSAITKKVGKIDVLVNNAGEAKSGNFFDNKIWKEQFENIFFSALHVSQKFLKQNSQSSLRKILNISSIYGNLGDENPHHFSYSVAKSAINGMTSALAKTNGKVLVNAIAPGYTWTPAWAGTTKKDKKIREDRTMIKRFVTPEEIAHAAIALLENDAITGQILTVDGGVSLTRFGRK